MNQRRQVPRGELAPGMITKSPHRVHLDTSAPWCTIFQVDHAPPGGGSLLWGFVGGRLMSYREVGSQITIYREKRSA